MSNDHDKDKDKDKDKTKDKDKNQGKKENDKSSSTEVAWFGRDLLLQRNIRSSNDNEKDKDNDKDKVKKRMTRAPPQKWLGLDVICNRDLLDSTTTQDIDKERQR